MSAPRRWGKIERPKDPAGKPATGRIAHLRLGQGDGFINVKKSRVYFHRADLRDGTAFNALEIGDAVTFELIEDAVSGARATRVAKVKS
jgi:cold shock CspA family protein